MDVSNTKSIETEGHFRLLAWPLPGPCSRLPPSLRPSTIKVVRDHQLLLPKIYMQIWMSVEYTVIFDVSALLFAEELLRHCNDQPFKLNQDLCMPSRKAEKYLVQG